MAATGRVLARAVTWPLVPVCLVLSAAVDGARPGPAQALVTGTDLPFLTAIAATWTVGIVLTSRTPVAAAGWAFLGLATALTASGLFDDYADLAVFRRGDVPAPGLAATLSDTSWVWWLVFMALVLCFTSPMTPPGALLSRLPLITVTTGLVYQIGALLRPDHLSSPYQDFVSPLALPGALGDLVSGVTIVAVFAVGVGVLGSAVRLVLAWRRAQGEARQQLLWLVAGALAVVPCVVVAFATSIAGYSTVPGVVLGLAIVCLAVGAALSVLRYRLYDVERVVTDSAGYAAAAAAVVGVFLAALALVKGTTPADVRGQLPTAFATLAAAIVARSVYLGARRMAEKRLDRGRFGAVETVRTGLAGAPTDLDALLRDALGDPTARLLYPAEDGSWITTGGRVAIPGAGCVEYAADRMSPPSSSSTPIRSVGRSSRLSPRQPARRSTTWPCAPSWLVSSRRSTVLVLGWQRRMLTSGVGWNATCTTGLSSACLRWLSSCSRRGSTVDRRCWSTRSIAPSPS